MAARRERLSLLPVINLCCLAYVLLRPVSANGILVPMLGLLAITSALTTVGRDRWPTGPLRAVIATQLAFGVFGVAAGFAYSAPGLNNGVLVYLAAPVLWWAWASQHSEQFIRWTFNVVVGTTLATSVALVLYAAAGNGLLPELIPASLLEAQGSGINVAGEYSEIRYYGLSTLAAAGPLCAAVAYMPRHRLLPAPRLALAVAAAAAAATLATGRRSQVVVMGLVLLAIPLVCRAVGLRRPRRVRREQVLPTALKATYALAATAVVALGSGLVTTAVVSRSFGTAFDLATGRAQDDDVVRLEQAGQLVGGWQHRPLAGNGFGAVIEGFKRNDLRPWNFELQYHLLLFQTGVVGVLLLGVIAWHARRAILRGWRVRPDLAAPFVASGVGATAMLLVNSINPYLQAPGHMWAVYLPFAVASVALRRRRYDATAEAVPVRRSVKSIS